MTAPIRMSVIIPTYNRKALCERAVRSVLEQKDPIGTEVIVVDNGSTDGTIESLRENLKTHVLSGRLRLLPLHFTGDPAQARNHGVRASGATWVAFLDSDDWWLPHRLEELAQVLENSDLCLAPSIRLGSNRDWIREYLKMNLGTTSSVVIRKELFEKAGGFPERYFGPARVHFPGFEDYELLLKCLLILRDQGRLARFTPLETEAIQVEPLPDGIGRRRLRDQMRREGMTLIRVLPQTQPGEWFLIAKRILGATKAVILG